jgi:hypothetical protein
MQYPCREITPSLVTSQAAARFWRANRQTLAQSASFL